MNLGGIMLSKISHTEKDSYCIISLYGESKNDLEGWGGGRGGMLGREGIYVSLWLICIVVWEKPTQHCTIFKIHFFKKCIDMNIPRKIVYRISTMEAT